MYPSGTENGGTDLLLQLQVAWVLISHEPSSPSAPAAGWPVQQMNWCQCHPRNLLNTQGVDSRVEYVDAGPSYRLSEKIEEELSPSLGIRQASQGEVTSNPQ